MPAKKTAKKKLTPRAEANKRYRANKIARDAAALIDSVIQPVVPEPNPDYQDAIEPTIVAHPDVFLDAENFNEFAPNSGMGEDPIDQETGKFLDEGEEEVFPESWTNFEQVETETEEQMGADAVSLPSPAPVVTSAPAPSHIVPQALPDTLESPSDALIVERLINGINHLYGFAKTIKGIRGLQSDNVASIQANLIQARALLARLK